MQTDRGKDMEKKDWFKNLKIGQKLLVCSVGIILIMSLFMGGIGYSISRNILLSKSEEQSFQLMEQLNTNYDYAIGVLEDFVTSQTHNKEFSALLRIDPANLGIKDRYDRRTTLEDYGYNLMNFQKSITSVLIGDACGNIYFVTSQKKIMDIQEQKACLDMEKAYEMWGVTYWKPYDGEQVFGTKVIFDYVNMKPVGYVAIGVDVSYFSSMYENIADEGSGVAILNEEQEILVSSDETSRELADIILKNYTDKTDNGREIYYRGEKYIYTTWKEQGSRIQVMNLLSESTITAVIFQKLLIPLLCLAGVAILLSGCLALKTSGQIASNIKLLLGNIRKISKGDFSQKIEPGSFDEIGMLAVEFNQMSEQIQHLLKTVADEKVQKKNSQLKALQFEYDSLQAKINPHFLYNTLESINSMAKINGQEKISDSIYMLGNYLREAISNRRKFVPLEEEMENLRQYVEIQKLSYGDKIQVQFQLDEATLEAMVPKLILQPLVENAIMHGIEPKIGKGHIQISSVCEKKDLLLTVRDDGVGVSQEKIEAVMNGKEIFDPRHTKVGIQAVHKRIRILYGENYGITIESEKEEGTCIYVRLPIRFEDEVEKDEL